jgi:hypothetical protein
MSVTTAYPNTQALQSTALTLPQMNGIIQPLTVAALGLLPEENTDQVRMEYPSEGQPFVGCPSDDVCFVRCMTEEEPYNKIRDKNISQNDDPDQTLTTTWNYTRVWRVTWCFYGPNSTDRARAMKSALFQDYFSDTLSDSNLFVVPDFPEPTRVPETFDGQWWERVDFEASLYEFVTETLIDQSVLGVDVTIQNVAGIIVDITVGQE